MTGGDAVYHALRALDVECVFGIVSVHNLPIYDAIERHGGIKTVGARHEQAAVHMADGYARTTGKLGVTITSTGPGAANGVPGLFEAGFASSPILMITGQIETRFHGRGKGFLHEAERQADMLRAITRCTESPRRLEDVAKAVLLAARDAMTGRPQPAAVEIPIDLQHGELDTEVGAFDPLVPPAPPEAALEQAAELLAGSRRRVVLAGGGVHAAAAHDALRELAEKLELPVLTTINGRGSVPENHPLRVAVLAGAALGSAPVQAALEEAEILLAVGTRFQGSATSNWELALPERLVHLDIDPAVIGRNYRPAVSLPGDARIGLESLLVRLAGAAPNAPQFVTNFREAGEHCRKGLRERIGPDHARIMDAIRGHLPTDGNVVRDATIPAYTWGNQLLPILAPRTSLNPTSGAIGPGLPMGIGAAVGTGRKTVVLSGDGGFMLNIGELATAAQYRLPVIVCLFNDRGYGILRLAQNIHFEGRTTGVNLHTPDFVGVAEAMGVRAERVASAAEFEAAFARAVACDGPVLLECDITSLQPIRLRG